MSAAATDLTELRRRHRSVLALSLAVIAMSLAFTTPDNRRVAFAGLPQFPLPELCQSRVWLGIECPGCGLTRSFIHFFHGRFADSVRLHRIGWLLALLTVVQIPYRLVALASPRASPLGNVFPHAIAFGVAVLLAANWVLKAVGI